MKKLLLLWLLLPSLLEAASSSNGPDIFGILREIGTRVEIAAPIESTPDLHDFAHWIGSKTMDDLHGGLFYIAGAEEQPRLYTPSAEAAGLSGMLRLVGARVEVVKPLENNHDLRKFAQFIGKQTEQGLQEGRTYISVGTGKGKGKIRRLKTDVDAKRDAILVHDKAIQRLAQRFEDEYMRDCPDDVRGIMYSDIHFLVEDLCRELVAKMQSLSWFEQLPSGDQLQILQLVIALANYKAGEAYFKMSRENFLAITDQRTIERIAIDVGKATARYFVQHPQGGIDEALVAGDSLYDQRCMMMSEIFYLMQQASPLRESYPAEPDSSTGAAPSFPEIPFSSCSTFVPSAPPLQPVPPVIPPRVPTPPSAEPTQPAAPEVPSVQPAPRGPRPLPLVTAEMMTQAQLRKVQPREHVRGETTADRAAAARRNLRGTKAPEALRFDPSAKLKEADFNKYQALPEQQRIQTEAHLTEDQKQQLTILKAAHDAQNPLALLHGGLAKRRLAMTGAGKDQPATRSTPSLPSVPAMEVSLPSSSTDAPPSRQGPTAAQAAENARKAEAAIEATKLARGTNFFAAIRTIDRSALRKAEIAARPTFTAQTGLPSPEVLNGMLQKAQELKEPDTDIDNGDSADWEDEP